MAKRSNNSLGRRSYGGKPYDANNSFVKKMATKVGDFMPQRSWISKWFNSSEDNGETNDNEHPEDGDGEEEVQPPATKRPRIRMDVTHPPGTFSIRRDGEATNDNHSRKDPYSHVDETGEDFLEPPVAGPSGVRSFVASTPAVPMDVRNTNSQRSELNSLIPSRNNRTSNGADDNSESSESTSGCSSLIPQTNRQEASTNSAYNSNLATRKRMIDEKMSFTNHLQSPRCLFLESGSRESLSSRRPSFNASLMTNTLERTSSLSSPFYTGNVTFGGANALSHYKPSRSLFNSTNEFQLKVPRRTSVQVKPSNAECIDSSGISQTAKRILEAMESFSSPISDAKKIPVKSAASPASGRKRLRDEEAQGATARVGLRHLTRELSVPTVPEMLKLRRRQKLQDTTVAARKIVTAMSSAPTSSATRPTAAPTEDYHLRTDQDENPKFHGKLRAKLKKNTDDEAPAPSVNLPRISLPITSLPSFEPLPKYTKPPTAGNRESAASVGNGDTFKFASPIKISESAWNLKSINNFSFSKPLSAEGGKDPDESREFNSTSKTLSIDSNSSIFGALDSSATANFVCPAASTAPRLKVKTKAKEKPDCGPVAKETSELKSGSVMNFLGSKTAAKSSPRRGDDSSASIWECADCYIKNQASEKICVACRASKPNGNKARPESSAVSSSVAPAKPKSDGFGSQFKMSSNQWECQSCLVRNQQTEAKCVSCGTPKSSEKSAAPKASPLAVPSTKSTLMEKFKPPEGSWECPGCMLRNPSAVITCPCCKAAKPSSLKISPNKTQEKAAKSSDNNSLMEKFKPASSSWECSSCMVRNNDTASSCVCCSNPKPGASKKSEEAAKTGDQLLPKFGFGDKFKKPENCWSCDSCMVQNKSEVTECVACGGLKPGATAKPASSQFSFGIPSNAQSFSFGVDKANEKSKETSQVSSNGFSFGAKPSSSESDSAANKFTFGIPKGSDNAPKSTESAPKATGFVFAAPKTADDEGGFKFAASKSSNAKTTMNDEKKAAATFSFGLPRAVETPGESESKTVFGVPAANGKPHFVFGAEKPDGTASDAANPAPKMTFGIPASDSSAQKPLVFGSGASQATSGKEAERPEAPSAKSGEQPASTTSASFASPIITATTTATNPPAENRAPFTFSEPKSKFTSETSIFGQNSATPAISTNSAAAASPFGVAPTSSASSQLVETPVETKSAAPIEKKPSFFEMPGSDKKASAFGAPEKKTPVFGAAENKLSAPFGSGEKLAAANPPSSAFSSGEKPANSFVFIPPSPAFGAPAAATTQPLLGNNTANPVFGAGTVPNFGNSVASGETPSIFAAAKSSAAPPTANPGLFTFGGANAQPAAAPAAAPAAFSFTGNATAANSASKSLFAFGGGAAAATTTTGAPAAQPSECFGAAGTSTAGAFGAPAAANPAPSPFTFNAPPKQEPPSFGEATGAIPSMFGAQPTAPSIGQTQAPQPVTTGFNFGAPAPAPVAGGFSFGGGMSQPATGPSSGQFFFNAPSPTPAIAFDPHTRPSFNFTGGTAPTAFNATPQLGQQPATTRKIKKAVRRMPQR